MLKFILNDTEVSSAAAAGTLLLDFIRYQQHLTGTKIGCREGDCGACTILVGEIIEGKLKYHTTTSCLMPLGNATGKHIVSIEGLNVEGLNVVQQAFADEGATQCGFCTPGFIVSLASFCISEKKPAYEDAIHAVNGNICRCTGYKSIERAAALINQKMQQRQQQDPLTFASENNIVPAYFSSILQRLTQLRETTCTPSQPVAHKKKLGGGTDLYVQQHEEMVNEDIDFLLNDHSLNGITVQGNICWMGASVTAADMAASPVFEEYFSNMPHYIKLISSTQIRNMATIAGNICNASPIGDFTIFFLALDAQLQLRSGETIRTVPLRDFYKGYKQMDKQADELLEKIFFSLPTGNAHFNFEKVCKRTHLDIATVNTALLLTMQGDVITAAGLSAGGVAAVPFYFSQASSFLTNKKISAGVLQELLSIIQAEIEPISDVRGSATYKRMLLQQLVTAHFLKFVPGAEAKGCL